MNEQYSKRLDEIREYVFQKQRKARDRGMRRCSAYLLVNQDTYKFLCHMTMNTIADIPTINGIRIKAVLDVDFEYKLVKEA